MNSLEARSYAAPTTTRPAMTSRPRRRSMPYVRALPMPALPVPQAQASVVRNSERLPVGWGLGIAFLMSLTLWVGLIAGAKVFFFG